MTHAEMMTEMFAARRESAHALEMLAQAIGVEAYNRIVQFIGAQVQ